MLKLLTIKLTKIFIIAFIICTFLFLGNLYTYKRLAYEKPIANLTFSKVNQQAYDATLKIGNSCDENIYRIFGDEWRIDTQFLKWKSWATLLGLNSMYRIERLSGRYIDIDDENSKQHSAHDLTSHSTINLVELAKKFKNKFPPVDTFYGSSAYKSMQIDILYTVHLTQSGILIRDAKLLSEQSNQCISNTSDWKNQLVKVDQKLANFIDSIF